MRPLIRAVPPIAPASANSAGTAIAPPIPSSATSASVGPVPGVNASRAATPACASEAAPSAARLSTRSTSRPAQGETAASASQFAA